MELKLFGLHVYKMVGVYQLKYMKKQENLSFLSVKKGEGLTNAFYGCEKVNKKKKKGSCFVIYSQFKGYWIRTAVKNECKVPNQVCDRGAFSVIIKWYTKA